MDTNINIRVSKEYKNNLELKAKELGFTSISSMVKHLIEKGLEIAQLRPAEYHMLSHTSQSTMLLREILKNISGNEVYCQEIVEKIRGKSIDWTDRFQETLKK